MKIVGVAIKKDDKIYSLLAPNRHCHVINEMVKQGLQKPVTLNAIQGFITDDDSFLNREEAHQLVELNGQNVRPLVHCRHLFSEDIW